MREIPSLGKLAASLRQAAQFLPLEAHRTAHLFHVPVVRLAAVFASGATLFSAYGIRNIYFFTLLLAQIRIQY